MRRFFRAVILLVGLVLVIAGVTAMIVVGPDDTVNTGAHRLSTQTFAITSSPRLLQFYGPTLRVGARSTTGRPVFVGVAGQADADSYLAKAPREVVDRFRVPWAPHARTVDRGGTARPVKPGGLDFWIVSATGKGERTVTWPIANGPYTIVVMNADASRGVSAQVKLGLQIAYAFVTSVVVAVVGLLLIVGGVLLPPRRPAAGAAPADGPAGTSGRTSP
jgi:hypothetical protein